MPTPLQLPFTPLRRLSPYDQRARLRARRLQQRTRDRLVLASISSFIAGVVLTSLYFMVLCRA